MKNNNARPARTARHAAPAASIPLFAHWRFSALAAAIVACASLHAPDVRALTLGTITVQSALGEPLRAEIDLPQITAAEAESLRAGTASADVFRTQGMEYSATVSQLRVQLQRRPDGRTVLRLSGSSPVNEPFVDLVLDAQWSAGHVTRSYTMLFDPPAPRRSQAAPVLSAPSISASENRNSPPPARRSKPVQTSAISESAADNAENARAATPVSPRRTAAPARTPAGPANAESTVEVRPGDTAGRIANARRQQGVSLDQMLVALSRANPSAFVEGNVNRLKSGSVLQIPSQDEALATPASQARQMVALQSRDFNAFRRNLASAAPDAEQAGSQRSASGSIQTRTENSSAAATAPDKLTLSKGAMQGKKTTEEMLAQRKQGNEAAARAQELARNIEELNRLNAASGTAAAAASAPPTDNPATAATAASSLALPNPGLTLPADPAASLTPASDTVKVIASESTAATEGVSNTAPAGAAGPNKTTNATADALFAGPPVSGPEAQPEPGGFVQDTLEQPALPLAGGALLLLLLYGGYRAVQSRRRHVALDSGFVDSRVHPDSFFGSSGGQRVDTASANSTIGGASLSYSPSQLDAGGEVDPVAEADVYLAYGRDLQAEEILREAARQHPQRVSIPAKLGEIYAKRLDSKALEAAARDVHRLTQGKGPEWEHMAKLGMQLEPDNALYHSSSALSLTEGLAGVAALGAVGSMPVVGATATRPLDLDLNLDLNLDFDLPDDALSEAPGEDLAPGSASDTEGEPASLAGAEDWDALEDLVAFNAAIALPPEPDAAPSLPAAMPEFSRVAEAQWPSASPLASAFQQDVLDTSLDTPTAQQTNNALNSSVDMHLDWETLLSAQPEAGETGSAMQPGHNADATASSTAALDAFALDFDLPDLDSPFFPASQATSKDSAQVQKAAGPESFVPNDSHLMEFDFDSLSLDLNTPQTDAVHPAESAMESGAGATGATASAEDPLDTKLALAQEFHAIGDSEGARTLIDEVIAESSGAVRVRAQNLLMELG